MSTKVTLPPGRIVWGHPLEKRIKTDPRTKKPILNKEGKEQDVWSFGVAYPLNVWPQIEPIIAAEAYRMYPQGNFPRDFSWKVKRETDLDENNKPYSEREGYAGSVVLSFSTQAFCPSAYKFENGAYRQLNANEFNTGDWVVVDATIDGHAAGVYVNPNMINVVGYDKKIERSSADPTASFGQSQYQLPPGVSQTPIAPAAAPGMPPQAGYAPQQAAGVPTYAQPSQGMTQQQLPPPAHDFVQNAMGQPQQPGFTQPPMQQPASIAGPHGAAPGMPPQAGYAPSATTYPSNQPTMPSGMPQGIPQR